MWSIWRFEAIWLMALSSCLLVQPSIKADIRADLIDTGHLMKVKGVQSKIPLTELRVN